MTSHRPLQATRASALALALLLGAQTSAAQGTKPLLSGSTNDIQWRLYRSGSSGNRDDQALHLAAPANSRVVGVNYDQDARTAVLAYTTDTSAQLSLAHFAKQFEQQGYKRVDSASSGQLATFERNGKRVTLRVTTQSNVHKAHVNLSGETSSNATASGSAEVLLRRKHGNTTVLLTRAPRSGELQRGGNVVHLVVPEGAQVVSADSSGGDVTARIRTNMTLLELREFYQRQFKRAGFTFTTNMDAYSGKESDSKPWNDVGNRQDDRVASEFVRGDTRVVWVAERGEEGVHDVTFQFEGKLD